MAWGLPSSIDPLETPWAPWRFARTPQKTAPYWRLSAGTARINLDTAIATAATAVLLLLLQQRRTQNDLRSGKQVLLQRHQCTGLIVGQRGLHDLAVFSAHIAVISTERH